MIRKISKNEIRERIHTRIRKKMKGTGERPRLAIFRSVAHIYAQVIDDSKGVTLVSASSVDKGAKTNGGNVAAAKAIGKLVAERAKDKGVKQVVFDRGTARYHGKVKALADAAREAARAAARGETPTTNHGTVIGIDTSDADVTVTATREVHLLASWLPTVTITEHATPLREPDAP